MTYISSVLQIPFNITSFLVFVKKCNMDRTRVPFILENSFILGMFYKMISFNDVIQ